MSLGIAIVGTGSIARHHARALEDVPGAQLVAVLSRDSGRAREFAERYGGTAYTELSALLEDSRVEALSVCTPSGAHLDVTEAAAAAGRHLFIEKPIEITAERCDRIVAAARRHSVKIAGVFQSRYFDNARVVRRALEAGRFGRLTMGRAAVKFFRSQEYYDDGGWKGTAALDGGGALMNQGIHAVDLLLWLMGPALRVHAATATLGHERIEVEDVAVATVEFQSGALGVIEGSTAVYPGLLKRIEISGTGGTAIMEEENLPVWSFASEEPDDESIRTRFAHAAASGGGASDPMAIETQAHSRQLADFVAAIGEDREPEVHAVEARKAVDLILAVYESARRGTGVEVSPA